MCFGSEETGRKTMTPTANPAVAGAATSNLNFVQNLRDKGFQGYTGPQVAQFSPDQQASFGLTNSIVGNDTAAAARAGIDKYAGAPAGNVAAGKIYDNMSPYMNQYVMQALQPQLRQMDIRNAAQDNALNAQATGSGAFGDARTGFEASNQRFNQNIEREGVIGQAYDRAFNTAIGAGAQDVGNKLAADNANVGYMEAALARSLGGSTALQNLQNQQLGVAGAQNTIGQQQTAQDQAGLTAAYNQWLMAQQYPFQTAGLVNQTTAAGAAAMPASQTTVEEKPNNSGWGLAGSLLGTGLSIFSDIRLKEDIDEIGNLKDGTPVFSYRYKGSPVKQIGLMAQDIEERVPEAVTTHPSGFKMVDYGRATAPSRLMQIAI